MTTCENTSKINLLNLIVFGLLCILCGSQSTRVHSFKWFLTSKKFHPRQSLYLPHFGMSSSRCRQRSFDVILPFMTCRHGGATSRHDGATSRHDGATSRHGGATSRHDGATSRHDGATSRYDSATSRHYEYWQSANLIMTRARVSEL